MAMRMMPGSGNRPELNIRAWAGGDRKGWLFFLNPADLRVALRPLVSGWCDMVIRFVMAARKQSRRVWIVLDELDSLNGLPAVVDGVTQMRESGNPMVLGMQSIAQLRKRYGQDEAEVVFSQPYTKVILPTSAPGSKKDLSDLIGESEFRRFRMSNGRGNSVSGPEEFRKPLVMPSEIGALKNLHGYFMQRGEIVPIELPYLPPRHFHPAMIERALPADAVAVTAGVIS
jgi:type IV secretory pathway TraG/TraD family ATPase VirD4